MTIGLVVVSPAASVIFSDSETSASPTVIVPKIEKPYLFEIVEAVAYLKEDAV
jgi:hypothetical protein